MMFCTTIFGGSLLAGKNELCGAYRQPKNTLLDSLKLMISAILFNLIPRLPYDPKLYYSNYWVTNVLFVCLLFAPLQEDLQSRYIMCLLHYKVILYSFLLYNRRRSHC